MEEIWKDIKDYEGLYKISNLGRVKRLAHNSNVTIKGTETIRHCKEGIMKQNIINNGYCSVGLYKNGKQKLFFVHRLVATAFCPNPYTLNVVNHKDENKTNNYASNLEWCTEQYNNEYGTRVYRISSTKRNKIGRAVIQCSMSGEPIKFYSSLAQAEDETGISRKNIHSAAAHKPTEYNLNGTPNIRKSAGGFKWEFVEKKD